MFVSIAARAGDVGPKSGPRKLLGKLKPSVKRSL